MGVVCFDLCRHAWSASYQYQPNEALEQGYSTPVQLSYMSQNVPHIPSKLGRWIMFHFRPLKDG